MQSSFYNAARHSVWLAILLAFRVVLVSLPAGSAFAQSNPVVVENLQTGTTAWQIGDKVSTDGQGQIKGYASAPSVNKGESINFYVSTNPPQTYNMDVYRIGWYQGLGGRLMQHIGPLNGMTQAACPRDATTGMVECNWAPTYTLQTQNSWTSGVYVVLMTNAQGFQNYMIFVVRDDNRVAALLYNQPVMTYQAYNDYPNDNATGKSLYEYNSFGPAVPATGTTRAAKVSFDRPYADLGITDFLGGTGEINFVRWAEKSGYDIAYSTDLDTHSDGYRLLNYRGFLAVGHDEYWSKQMYDAAVAARDAGVNLGFFGSDPVYWQIRLEDSSVGSPNRVIACYKDETRDPNSDPSMKTVLWRDPPLSRPEQQLVGVMYTSMPPYNNNFYAPYVVTNSSNWVYAGTGFQDGNSATALVGYEADRLFSDYPGPNAVPGTYTLLSHSPYQSVGGPDHGNSSVYQAPSGAWVFSSGSMNWNWGLDSYADGVDHGWFPAGVVDARIQKATANVLDRFKIGALPDFSVTASPSSFTLAPGNSTSYGVTISPFNSFTGAVTLSVGGLPTGATGTFTPNPATGSSTLTVTTTASTPVGAYTLIITGVSGSLTHTTSVSLNVTIPDFSLSATPSTQTVLVGGGGNYSVTITPVSGFNSAVTLSVSGLPAGATGTFTPNPATGSSTLTVSTAITTPVGTYPLTIAGVSGSLTHTTTTSVTVSTTLPPPGVFLDTVGPSAAGASVASGSSLTWNHTVTSSGSNLLLIAAVSVGASPDTRTLAVTYNGVAMTSVGLVHSNNGTLGYTQMFYLKAPATGTHAVLVTVTGGTASLAGGSASFTGVDQTTPVRNVATKFGTGVSPNVTVTSSQGDMVVDSMVNGCDGTITSSKTLLWLKQVNCSTAGGIGAQSMAAGAPSVTMGYTVPSDWWAMIGVDVVGAPAPPATDFNLSTEGDKSVTQGTAVTNAVTANLVSGIAQNVTFSVSGLPTGVTASFTPGNCTPNCGTTLTLTASASATVGAFPITLTGTAGSVIRTTTFTLNVSAPIVPDFSLSATPTSQTLSPGGATSYSVNIARINGFSGTVTFSVSGLPTGATGTFTPNLETAGSTLTVTTTSSTPAGTYPLTITGVSGSLTHTTPVSLTINAPDFSLSATPPSQSVAQGASGSYSVTITPTNGFSSTVTLGVTGLPTGATGTFAPNPATGSSTLTVATTSTTPAGTYTLTTTGVSGSLTRTTTVSITVNAVDFSLSATPPSQTVAQGASGDYSVTITPTNGFSSPVTFSVSGLPTGATGTFTPNPGTTSATLTVATTAGTTPAGTYPLTITGVSGSLTHTTSVSVTVNVPDFSVSATPASQTVVQGASGNYNINITPTNGFSSAVTFSVSGLPAGATGSFTPNPATGSVTLTVATTAGTTPGGTYPLTITGVSGSLSHTAPISITVTVPDFSLGATPASQTVAQGASGNYSVTITPTNGFADPVTFSISGLPTGATGTFTPNPATGSATLAVASTATTPAGTYPLTITGVSGSLTHTAAISITVNVPDFSLSATPPSQTVVQGASGSYSVTINPANGFASAVTFSVSGLPEGATGTFTPNPATGSATLAVTTTAGTTPGGTYPLTITGVSGSLSHTAPISVTVTVPDFSLSATPPSQTIVQGTSGNYSVTITPANGFTDAVTFSVSGLPAGATGTFTPNPATGSATLTVATTAGTTPGGTYPLTITGISGSLSHTAAISITVTVPDFSLGATPASQTVVQGASGNYNVTITPTNGFSSAVTFSVSGLPAGATGTFTPNPATGSATLAVATSAGTTPGGTYPLTITGVSGSLSHTAPISITVTVPDFSLGATPASQTVVRGASGNYSVTITPINGFSSTVTFSVAGLPTGATGTFTPNPATGSATLAVATTASTPGGTYPLIITGVSGSLSHTAAISITVTVPDFSLGATPASQSVVQGGSANYGVTITPINSFNSAVTFSVSGLPTGATGTFTPNPATGSATLAVTTTASTPIGTYPLTVTGISGALTHTAAISLTVTTTLPPAGVAFDAVGPSAAGAGAASVAAGGTLTWNHTITSTGSNTLLTVAVSVGSSPDTARVLAVTYNGVAMTPLGLVHSNNGTLGYTQMFYLRAPAPGLHAVLVTLTGGKASLAGGSVSFTGVDQTTPIRNVVTKFGTGVSPNVIVTSTPGNMVVDAMVTGCDGTITSSKTLRWLKQVNCSTAGGIGAQATAAGAASVTMGYTVPSDWWGMIGVDIVAAH